MSGRLYIILSAVNSIGVVQVWMAGWIGHLRTMHLFPACNANARDWFRTPPVTPKNARTGFSAMVADLDVENDNHDID